MADNKIDKEEIKKNLAAAKKRVKQRAAQKLRVPEPNTVTGNRLKLLVTVVNRNKAEFFVDLLQSFDVNLQTVLLANGTANAKMLDLLGLTNNEKAVILSVIQENKIPDALHTVEEKFTTIKDGKGVAFTVALTSVIGTLIYGFLSDNRTVVKNG